MSVACPSVQGMTTAASLSLEARDRARGVVLGMAVGDALGAPFEFNPPIGPDAAVAMFGGGSFGWAPGEWTDDTSMAIPLVRVLADGGRLDNPDALARVVRDWREWALAAPDVGTQTRNVLGRLGPDATEADARAASEAVHDEHCGRSGGNGSLMRTAPVVLAQLDDEFALIAAARRVSELTHWEADAGDACAIWCVAAARAIASGSLDVRSAVDTSVPDAERAALWHRRLDEAERLEPSGIANNGWVVAALQAAWSAISRSSSLAEARSRGALRRRHRHGRRDRGATRGCPLGRDGDPRRVARTVARLARPRRRRPRGTRRPHPRRHRRTEPYMTAPRTAIVTGAARGLGEAIAHRLAADDMRVGVLDRDADGAERVAAAIRDAGGDAFAAACDVTSADSVAAAVAAVADALGTPTVLVNNAGILRDALLFKMSEDEWDAIMNVHLKGAFLMTREAQRHMVDAGWGRVVNLSSVSALGNRGQANYSAAKAGIQGFTKTLAIELGPFGVTANVIAPGYIETDMTRATAERVGKPFEQFRDELAATVPVRRMGVPADIAGVASFLCSDDAAYVSGQVLYVAGGPTD